MRWRRRTWQLTMAWNLSRCSWKGDLSSVFMPCVLRELIRLPGKRCISRRMGITRLLTIRTSEWKSGTRIPCWREVFSRACRTGDSRWMSPQRTSLAVIFTTRLWRIKWSILIPTGMWIVGLLPNGGRNRATWYVSWGFRRTWAMRIGIPSVSWNGITRLR